MIFKRWYRQLGGLAVLLLIVFATVFWTNGAINDKEASDINASLMTKARAYSDAAWRRGDYADAAVHLGDLLQADPHNSHARFLLAKCYHQQFVDSHSKLHDPEGIASTDPERLKSIELELKELGDLAVKLYQRCTQSHRYRGESLIHLSVLFGWRKDREKTLASLKRFLSLNYSTGSGIAQFSEFAFLLDDPEFQQLIVAEQKVKRDKKNRRSLRNS